jgi:hypothetical protein
MTGKLLYHYTNGHGLLGILRSRCLWCTHISYLNDSQEYKHGESIYGEMLTVLAEDSGATDTAREFAKVALMHLARHGPTNDPMRHPTRHFVASLSALDDDLSQWRAYTGSGSLPRFAIGFKVDELRKLHAAEGMRLCEVKYDGEHAKQDMRKKFLLAVDDLSFKWLRPHGTYDKPIAIHPPEFYGLSHKIVEEHSPTLKHPKFKDEAEWRLITDSEPSYIHLHQSRVLNFRPGRSFLIPYTEVPLDALTRPIAEIVVGPTPHREEAKLAVQRLLGFKGSEVHSDELYEQRVRNSEVPYRDW